jgi:hypothetical protein
MRTILVLLAVAFIGCGSSDTCTQNPASCADAGQGTCTGQCTPAGVGPDVLLWSGPAGTTPPACPAVAPTDGLNGFLDTPPSSVTCSPACACSTSVNGCNLPSTMTAGAVTCPSSGGLPFNAPEVWDGTCSAMDPVASAGSLIVDPPTVDPQGGCPPSLPMPVSVVGETIAINCLSDGAGSRGDVPGECADLDQLCAYPSVPGFTVCTTAAPGSSCANVPGWPVQHTFYFASCDCKCGPPVGEACTTTVDAYSDSTCSDKVGSIMLTSNDGPTCSSISPASPLGSKSATVNYTPGTCAPTLTQIGSYVLCCLN